MKIQAHARGFLTRKQLNEELNNQHENNAESGALNRPSFTAVEPNYINNDVQAIRDQLGEFDYGTEEV